MTSFSRRQFICSGVASLGLLTMNPFEVVFAEGKKILRSRLEEDFQILDPAFMLGGDEQAALYVLFPKLAELDFSQGTVAWRPSEYVNSLRYLDDKHIEFELKSGFQWTGGYGELTAEDVKYSFERMKNSDYEAQWKSLNRVDITGRYSGTIVLDYAYGPLVLESLSMGVGCIVCKQAVEQLPEKKFELSIPASCGPYVLSTHVIKQKAIFTRNPDWAGKKPYFDEIQCIVVEDSNSAELAFEADELDITRVDSKKIPFYQKSSSGVQLTIAGHLNHGWMGMNTQHPKLSNADVRKAIQCGIDVERILKVVYKGVTERAYGIIPPGIIGRRTSCGYKYDPKESKSLLKKAGVDQLALDLVVLNSNREMLLTAQMIQSDMKALGISIKILPLDPGPYWELGDESAGDAWKNSQLWLMNFGGTVDPSGYFQWFVKDQIGKWNWERWSSEEFDKLYAQGASEADADKRGDIYIRMQEIMEDTGAYVWLNHEPEAFIYNSSIQPAIDVEGVYIFASTHKS